VTLGLAGQIVWHQQRRLILEHAKDRHTAVRIAELKAGVGVVASPTGIPSRSRWNVSARHAAWSLRPISR
jgi:hypothetical protein